jgi:GntR family transcriptional regulator
MPMTPGSKMSSIGQGAVPRPLYSQVRDLMIDRIEAATWPVGAALPNEFQLSSEFGVSVGTIRKAVEGLEEAGILIRKQGRGTFVAGSPGSLRHARLYPFRLADGALWSPIFDDASLTRRKATRDDHRIAGPIHQDLVVFERVGRHDGLIVLDETVVVPARFVPDFGTVTATTVEMRHRQSDAGFDIAKVVDVLTAIGPQEERRPALATAGAILRIDRRLLDGGDRTLEWGTCWVDTTKLRYVGTR